ncbi:MAG: imidazole glycerol phosphate synthase subunit HisH [Bacteroidota bacterium]|jgi:glutamine amidotransferase
MVTIVDYGVGNVGSIANMLKYLRIPYEIAQTPEQVMGSKKLILPGVGSFDNGVRQLQQRNLFNPINELVISHKIPILGICLGMQLMTITSAEGELNGFGWLNANVYKFPSDNCNYKVPHIGWEEINLSKLDILYPTYSETYRFYFVHSYYVQLQNIQYETAWSTYSDVRYTASFRYENIWGVQFHPEKSHSFGKRLLMRFYEF